MSILFIILIIFIFIYRTIVSKSYNTSIYYLELRPINELKKYFCASFLEINKIYVESIFVSVITLISLLISINSVIIEQRVSNIYAEQLIIDKSQNILEINVEVNNIKKTITITNYGGKIYDLNATELFSIQNLFISDLFNIKQKNNNQIILTGNKSFVHLDEIINIVQTNIKQSQQTKFIFEKYILISYRDYQEKTHYLLYTMSDDYNKLYLLEELSEEEINMFLPSDEDIIYSLSESETIESFSNKITEFLLNNH